ncbi:MAG: hypothetical protein J0M10_14570 [Chitinophagales bacterium]|nr:hypothetical protein [Chitinophagales bacterium]
MRILIVVLLLFSCSLASTQTRQRWEEVVGWDGVSHWSRYMITLPAFQGPNSLPVPQPGNGRIDSNSYIGVSGAFHFMEGDHTQNLVINGHIAVVKDVVGVELTWVPWERYNMSTAIKEKRHVYYENFNDKKAAGDLMLNTNFRLFKKWAPVVDFIFQIGYRMPSGTDYGSARYSDGPGYHFAINMGKPLNKAKSLKLTTMAGFYVWQIESDIFKQDDAFLFGAGIEYRKKNFSLHTTIAGYLGYLEKQGDKPVVFRTRAEQQLKKMKLVLGFQQGLNDFEYSSFDAGLRFNFNQGK